MPLNTGQLFVQEKPPKDSVVVKYRITTKLKPKEAAIKLCKEQSLSNALGDDAKIIRKYSAKYVLNSIRKLDDGQFDVDVAFPLENCGSSLSMVLSAAGGDTYNIKDLYPIKILDITLPKVFIRSYPGPRFGISGLRKELNVYRAYVNRTSKAMCWDESTSVRTKST